MSETKNHRRYEQPLPPALTAFIDRYLEVYRPRLLGGSDDDRLWILAGQADVGRGRLRRA